LHGVQGVGGSNPLAPILIAEPISKPSPLLALLDRFGAL